MIRFCVVGVYVGTPHIYGNYPLLQLLYKSFLKLAADCPASKLQRKAAGQQNV